MNAPNRQFLLDVNLNASPSISQCRIARIDLAPGQATGAHRHPCDVVGYILSGTIRFQVADQPPMELHAGDAFFEPRNVVIPHFDNADDRQPATFLAYYLLGPGEDRVIEMIKPE